MIEAPTGDLGSEERHRSLIAFGVLSRQALARRSVLASQTLAVYFPMLFRPFTYAPPATGVGEHPGRLWGLVLEKDPVLGK